MVPSMRLALSSLDTSHPIPSFQLTPLTPCFPSFSPIDYSTFILPVPPPSPPHHFEERESAGDSSPETSFLETPAGSPASAGLVLMPAGDKPDRAGGITATGALAAGEERVKMEEMEMMMPRHQEGQQDVKPFEYALEQLHYAAALPPTSSAQGPPPHYSQAIYPYPLYSHQHPPHPLYPLSPSLAPGGISAAQPSSPYPAPSHAQILAMQQHQHDQYRHAAALQAAQAQQYAAHAMHQSQLHHHHHQQQQQQQQQMQQQQHHSFAAHQAQTYGPGHGQASFETPQGTYYFVSNHVAPNQNEMTVLSPSIKSDSALSTTHSGSVRADSMEGDESEEEEEEQTTRKVVKSARGRKEKKVAAKRFVCEKPGCGVAFARRFNLKSHENAHLGIRDFNCPRCPKQFSRRHDRARHCAAVHGLREDD